MTIRGLLSMLTSLVLLTGVPVGMTQNILSRVSGYNANDAIRTVMVYMVGSNLESESGLASADIQEMLNSKVDFSRVNVVIGAGGSSEWSSLALKNGQMSVFELQKGSDPFRQIDTVSVKNMGASSTLSYFLEQAVSACPASNYDLILWNHGGGPINGYGFDSVSHDNLTLSEIDTALSSAGFGEGRKLEIIGYDACMMGTVEVAAMMKPYAEYMVASEEVIAGQGWDYNFLGKSVIYGKDTKSILKEICNSYEKSFGQYPDSDYTLSALQLSQISSVWNAMDELLCSKSEFSGSGDYSALTNYVNRSCAFSRFSSGSNYDLFDLGDFADKSRAKLPRTSEALRRAVDRCVVYNVSNMSGAVGIGFYFPVFTKEKINDYLNDVCSCLKKKGFRQGYASFLRSYSVDQGIAEPTLELPTVQGTVTPGATTYSVQLPRELHARFSYGYYYILKRYEDEPNAYRMLERGYDINLDSDGTLMISREFMIHNIRVDRNSEWAEATIYGCDYRDGVSRYEILLGTFPSAQMYFENPKEQLYSGSMELQFEVSADNPNGIIKKLVPETEGGMAPRELHDLEAGYTVFFVWPVLVASYNDQGELLPFEKWPEYNPDGLQGSEWLLTEPSLDTAYLPGDPDSEYFVQLVMADIYGNTYASDLMRMQ